MKGRWATVSLLMMMCLPLLADEPAAEKQKETKVEYREFATKTPPPAYKIPQHLEREFELFQQLLANPSERITVRIVFLGASQLFGIAEKQADKLGKLLEDVYKEISEDAAFSKLKSALPYCFATKPHSKGQYNIYLPAGADKDSEVIIFLHGYGGNFIYYTWVLAQEFPGAIVLVPSCGVSWEQGKAGYLKDMMADTDKHLEFELARPWLFALSAGGPAGFRIYGEEPGTYKGLVSIASAPYSGDAKSLKKDMRILMINGKADDRFPLSIVTSKAKEVEKAVRDFEFVVVEGDHFFMLSNREECFGAIKKFMHPENR